MAGLFQVLWGVKKGGFEPAKALLGSDGKPLIITIGDGNTNGDGDDHVTDKICTRPTAVDLDGDGKLDIVAGNFTGTFALFRGEGKGKFAPRSTWLTAEDAPLRVDAHSDPFFIDWDGDGDLDMLSGSSNGTVSLVENQGSKTAPKFGKPTTLLQPGQTETGFGDAHIKAPGRATRVFADDVNGDGKFDLLIGDTVSLSFVADGVKEATAKKEIADIEKREQQLFATRQRNAADADADKFNQQFEKLRRERAKFVREESTGFVWVMRQK